MYKSNLLSLNLIVYSCILFPLYFFFDFLANFLETKHGLRLCLVSDKFRERKIKCKSLRKIKKVGK